MAEKPRSWTPRVIEGGKSGDVPTAKPEPTREPVLPTNPKPVSEAASDGTSTIRAEELLFSLQGGWKQEENATGSESPSEISKESDLVRLYLDISGKPPANFSASVRPERVQEAAKILPAWSVDALHKYLSGSEVWKRPSFTKAVFEEIRERMLLGKMDPRE
jgi:hypothetical protein